MLNAMLKDRRDIQRLAATLRALPSEKGMPIGYWLATPRRPSTRPLRHHIAIEDTIVGHTPINGFEHRRCEPRAIIDWRERRMPRDLREFHHPRLAAA